MDKIMYSHSHTHMESLSGSKLSGSFRKLSEDRTAHSKIRSIGRLLVGVDPVWQRNTGARATSELLSSFLESSGPPVFQNSALFLDP